jgi:hypothetical protein
VRRAADRPAHRGARAGDARRRPARPTAGRDASALAPGDAREARCQRRDGGLRAGGLSAHRHRGRGDARSVVQPLRGPGDDASGRAAPDRARADRGGAGRARRQRLLRPGLPRQRDDWPGDPAHPAERRRRLAGPARHGDSGKPRKVLLLHGRAPGRALGPAARDQHGDGVRRGAAAQRERSRLDDRCRHSRDGGRHVGLARVERRLVLLPESAADRAGSRARADDREGRIRPRGYPAIHLRARAAPAAHAEARRHVGHPGLAALDARGHRRRRAAPAGAVAGGRDGHRRRRSGQALGGRPELHLQPSGVTPDPPALTARAIGRLRPPISGGRPSAGRAR